MATKAADREELRALRGTKRTCQNADCGSRFYDLAKDPITCPICSTVYELARQVPQPTQAPAPEKRPPRPAAPKELDIEGAKAAPEDELAAVEGEEVPAAGEEDDTFLEEMEEEPSNVTGIIDAPIEDTDEKG